MGLEHWLENVGHDVVSVAKATLLPDMKAWGDIVHGHADWHDVLSAGLDVAGFVPGGMLLKSGGKAAIFGAKHADEVRQLAKWTEGDLHHAIDQPLQGNKIFPASRGGFEGLNASRQGVSRTTTDKVIHANELTHAGDRYSEHSFHKLNAQASRPEHELHHADYAFASKGPGLAKGLMNHYMHDESRQILKVAPVSPLRKQLVRTNPKNAYDALEILDHKGFRVVGGEGPRVAKTERFGPGIEDFRVFMEPGKTWLASDASRTALHKEIRKSVKAAKWSLPTWGAAGAAQTQVSE